MAVALVALSGCSGDAAPSRTDPPPSTGVGSTTTPSTAPVAAASTTTSTVPDPLVVGTPSRLDDLAVDELIARLTAAEQTLRDPATDDPTATRAGVTQQLIFRKLAARPEIDDKVVASMPDDVRPTVERVVAARQFAQARSAANPSPTPPASTLPAWTVVEPLPVDELRGYYDEAEQLTGVPWYWLAAINLQETRMGRIVGVSSAGAVGPMQFLPSTWAECCEGDPLVPRDAIIGAATYLAQSGAPTDMAAAVRQYNPNDSYVALVTAYAENLRDEPSLYRGYHAWQVFVSSAAGTVRLPVGFTADTPVDAATHLAAHPDDRG